MEQNTVIAETSLIELENAAIEFFRKNAPRNPKKLQQFVRRVYGDFVKEIQKGLLDKILVSPSPVKTLDHIILSMDQWYEIVPGMIATGYHGMIIEERGASRTVHGFHLKAQEKWLKEKVTWDPEQEKEIKGTALRQWMEESKLLDFKGKVVLFDNFGFSGTATPFLVVNGKPKVN